MCVYCKGSPACDHERDSCEASRGDYCAKCDHDSAVIKRNRRMVVFSLPEKKRNKG